MSKVLGALRQLDPSNDSHWTAEGLPRLDTVKLFAQDGTVTRESLAIAAPGFSRTNNVLAGAAQTDPGAAQAAAVQGTGTLPATIAPAGDAPLATVRNGDSNGSEATPSGAVPGSNAKPGSTELQDAIEAAAQLATERRAAALQADQALKASEAALDALLTKQALENPPLPLSNQIQSYQESQRKALEHRAAQLAALLASGFKLSDILPTRSALDNSLARKTARGTQRPTF